MSDRKSARSRKEPERYTEAAAPKAKKVRRSKSPKASKTGKGSKKSAAGKGKGKAGKGGKAKAGKKKKDPNAPKRATSAFFYYVADNREAVKKAHPKATFGELGKLLGEQWKSAAAKDKKKYEDQAAKDKARYQKEMASYKKKSA